MSECTLYSTRHTLCDCAGELASALTAATILADAAVTPPSPKWPKMCQVDVKPHHTHTRPPNGQNSLPPKLKMADDGHIENS